jgi:hypothetical protein
MQLITPIIKLHTSREYQGTYLNCLIIEHQGNNYHLHGSTGTTIHAYSESICLYILSINRTLNSIGLFAYMAPEPDVLNSVSLHNNQEIKDILGQQWEQMKPDAIVKRLLDYLN